TWLGMTFAAAGVMHLGWWCTVRRLRREGRLTPTLVIVGANKTAEKLIANALEHRDVAILGVFDDRLGRAPADIAGVPVLGDVDALLNHRMMPYVDRVVVTVASTAQARIREISERLRTLPNEVTLLVDAKDGSDAAAISRLADMPLAKISGSRLDPDRAFAKRLQDLVLGVLLLVPAAPVMAAVALAVRLDSPGPILFRQRRQGFNNEEIVVWKFRSMKHEARSDEDGVRQVSPGDARVTRVGRFIRSTSLDELPQLWNVLRGEMSLVGPRPHEPTMKTGAVQSSRLIAEYAHRHRMKPGMTGWAAVHGSRGPLHTAAQVRARVALDIEYIERQSFWLDLYIMLKTLPCLLGDRRAAR
ncbi:MAG: exopolysaccharide biosynthesis polyprenyl glycosylphosphotransferase, partial [Caulobacteraceae bacterium]|nr:exopolysaccharide biosynthesis polyprenyl glycosylphosphotransferase [Caulobacteraceae bacterium]